jgi:hypothetical protein
MEQLMEVVAVAVVGVSVRGNETLVNVFDQFDRRLYFY